MTPTVPLIYGYSCPLFRLFVPLITILPYPRLSVLYLYSVFALSVPLTTIIHTPYSDYSHPLFRVSVAQYCDYPYPSFRLSAPPIYDCFVPPAGGAVDRSECGARLDAVLAEREQRCGAHQCAARSNATTRNGVPHRRRTRHAAWACTRRGPRDAQHEARAGERRAGAGGRLPRRARNEMR